MFYFECFKTKKIRLYLSLHIIKIFFSVIERMYNKNKRSKTSTGMKYRKFSIISIFLKLYFIKYILRHMGTQQNMGKKMLNIQSIFLL